MNESDLRDCFAMFALMGVISDGSLSAISFQNKTDVQKDIATFAYEVADQMLEARKQKEPEEGIVAIKKRVRKS